MTRIIFTCDPGTVADSLRQLANAMESSEEELSDFETFHAAATIEYDV